MKSIREVVERQMCSGCGICAYASPDRIEMVDALEYGRRPVVKGDEADPTLDDALAACPGAGLTHTFDRSDAELIQELVPAWGPIYEVWEGYAADADLRYSGSSGGAASALALYGLEREGFAGVLHTAARKDVPYLNETVLSRSREEVLAATGSRYAPASPCDSLDLIEKAEAPCAFIGKPCDVAAVQQLRSRRPQLDAKLGITIGFFCAGAPSTQGTLDMLKGMGVEDLARVKEVRYRGRGWPGMAMVRYEDEGGEERVEELTYQQSWGELQRYRQWRCYVCADHVGEFADIAVGDPWYRPIEPGDPGRSLILARTKRGQEYLARAHAAGYLEMERAEPSILPRSQQNLLSARGSLWSRLITCRLFGAAAPRYRGFPMFRFWLSQLGFRQKISSITGTIKRVFRKKLRTRISFEPWTPPRVPEGEAPPEAQAEASSANSTPESNR